MKSQSGPSTELTLGIRGYTINSSTSDNSSEPDNSDSEQTITCVNCYNNIRNEFRGRSIKREREWGENNRCFRDIADGVSVIEQKKVSELNLRRRERVGFTLTQLGELSLQLFIYKCFVLGFPLPLHALISFWRTVSVSFSLPLSPPPPPQIRPVHPWRYPSSPRFSFRELHKQMDPEPGRCRRTDGKKWRCSRNVVQNQKYCEKHMHRGAGRSRKLVEASTSTDAAAATTRLINLNTTATHHDTGRGPNNAPPNYNSSKQSRPYDAPPAYSMHKRLKEDHHFDVKHTVKTEMNLDAPTAATPYHAEGIPSHTTTSNQLTNELTTKIVLKNSAVVRS